MSEKKTKRKLTAILSADVVGYSRLMGEDEEQTVETLNSYREIMTTLIDKHDGNLVDAVGDNLLAQFTSIVDAVRCAVEIQNILKKQNENLSENRRMFFRIGINIGDVIQDKERIYGDGVNIAARIESLADLGGICISRGAYDQIKKKLDFGYEYIGEHSVKNISDPVRVYKIIVDPEDVGKLNGIKKNITPKLTKALIFLICISIILLGVLGGLYRKYIYLPTTDTIDLKDNYTFDLPKGPSIAVLPFVNITGDKEQELLCDGITENIIFALSHVKGLLVIARNSSFSYKGKSTKVQQIGQDLGVEYLIEGSLQKLDKDIRLKAQLIDTKRGHHVWSDIYDGSLNTIFAMQDEIVLKICEAMQLNLTEGETFRNRLKGVRDIKIGVKLQKAMSKLRYGYSRENVLSGLQHIEEVVDINPNIPQAYGLLATYNLLAIQWGVCEKPLLCFAKATESVKKALSLDENNSDSHMVAAYLFLMKKEHEKALNEMKIALSINPNNGDAYTGLGYILFYAGEPLESISFIKKGIQIDPIPPIMYLYILGAAYYESQQYEKGLKIFEQTLKKNKDHLGTHVRMAASYARLGDLNKARKSASEILRVKPDFNLNDFLKSKPYKNEADLKRHYDNLRLAGLPE